MGQIEAYNHLVSKTDKRNCATTALHSMLNFLPEEESSQALYRNTYSLYELYNVVGHELSQNGVVIKPLYMDSEDRPSRFFYQVAHALRHGPKGPRFIGGLMLTQEEEVRHVIAITGVHESRKPKFDIVDTAPHCTEKPMIRTVAGNFLDRRVITSLQEPSAIVIAGMDQYDFERAEDYTPELSTEIEEQNSYYAVNTYLLSQRAKNMQ